MEITEVNIKLLDDQKVKAYANVVFDNVLAIHNIKILDGKKGFFIAMPSKKVGDRFRDIIHPLNSDFRNEIQDTILKKFNEEISHVKSA